MNNITDLELINGKLVTTCDGKRYEYDMERAVQLGTQRLIAQEEFTDGFKPGNVYVYPYDNTPYLLTRVGIHESDPSKDLWQLCIKDGVDVTNNEVFRKPHTAEDIKKHLHARRMVLVNNIASLIGSAMEAVASSVSIRQ